MFSLSLGATWPVILPNTWLETIENPAAAAVLRINFRLDKSVIVQFSFGHSGALRVGNPQLSKTKYRDYFWISNYPLPTTLFPALTKATAAKPATMPKDSSLTTRGTVGNT